MRTRSFLMSMLSCSVLAACTANATHDENVPPAQTAASDACSTDGAMSCEGLRIRRCARLQGQLRWSDPVACDDGESICKDGDCRALTKDETARTAALDSLLDESRRNGATARPVDYDAVRASLREALLLGDGSERAYVRMLWQALLAIPQGHQMLTLSPSAADEASFDRVGLSQGSLTRYGACLRPYGDHAVVTLADGTTTTLKRGDEVVAIDGKRGDAFVDALLETPFGLDVLPPTRAGRVAFATRAFFGVERSGTVLTVRSPGTDAEHDVTLPTASAPERGFSCDDAFGRNAQKPAIATVLPDGTGVLYVPSFAQTSAAAFEHDLAPAYATVKDAPRVIVDVRGNGGGRLTSALALVGGFPNAQKKPYCAFFEREPGSNPPSYVADGAYSVEPTTTFALSGKVAVLVDGATHSAADHLALAAKVATSALVVGTPTAGAYGKVNHDVPRDIAGTPPVTFSINRSQVRTPDGAVLEGTSLDPDVVVEYEPDAIARGHDPMLERAIAELAK